MVERIKLNRKASGSGRNKMTENDWAKLINSEWRKSVPSIVKTGHLLNKAKKTLGHGRWMQMVDGEVLVGGKLDFSLRIAHMLMRIADNPKLSNVKNFSHLPPAYATLNHLTGFASDDLQNMIDKGFVHSGMKLADAKRLHEPHFLANNFGKTVASLMNFMSLYPEPDDETISQVKYHCGQSVNLSPQEVRERLLPWLEDLFRKMEDVYLERKYCGAEQTERDGKIVFREEREVADPMANDDTSTANGKSPPPKKISNGDRL